MRNGMYRKRKAILETSLAHQLGNVGFHRALFDASCAANFLVRSPSPKHVQNPFLADGKGRRNNTRKAGSEWKGAWKSMSRRGSVSTTAIRMSGFLARAAFIAFLVGCFCRKHSCIC